MASMLQQQPGIHSSQATRRSRGSRSKSTQAALIPLPQRCSLLAQAGPWAQQEPQLRCWVCRAAPSPGKLDKAAVRENVDRAAAMLDQMLSTIMREMFVEQATAYVTDEQPDLSESQDLLTLLWQHTMGPHGFTLQVSDTSFLQAVRNAVAERIEQLDANFLASLNAYIQVAQARKEEGLCELLEAVRNEVLRQVAQRLPPAARAMDAAMQHADKDQRVALLRWCLYGLQPDNSSSESGRLDVTDLPTGISAEEVMTSLTQLIDDMEEQQVIADRQLLSRMCLLREEVRWLDQELAFTQGQPSDGNSLALKFARRNVPQRSIAFLKELLRVADSAQRVALLTRAFTQDWDGAAPVTTARKQQDAASTGSSAPDYVRPGRFMTTLLAVESQMEEELQHGTGAQDPQNMQAVLRRLSELRLEAVTVLDRIQRTTNVTATASSTSNSSRFTSFGSARASAAASSASGHVDSA